MIENGYKHDEDGHLIIGKEKAKNVKLIFELYLNGQSVVGIIKEAGKTEDSFAYLEREMV